MFGNIINSIKSWFSDLSERSRLVDSFNTAAKNAYVRGIVPTYLKASISRGDSSFRHQHSHWLNSGFRVAIFNGSSLSKNELMSIGATLMSDQGLIRQMVVLGFDTLEIFGERDMYGLKWPLKDLLIIDKF
ncbi:MAG: hypothetical protein ACKOX3_09135 [Bacteroidota bacterium]